jgi:hypothetical protein
MNGKSVIRCLAISVTIPIGSYCGVLVADWLCRFLPGGGTSHGDIATVLGAEALGVLVGALLLPFCVWYITRRARN